MLLKPLYSKLWLVVLICASFIPASPPKKKIESYLMAFYLGDGRTGMHLAWSENGLHWQPLRKGKNFVRPGIGDYVMREPHLIAGPDGFYHLVWSTGVSRLEIGYTRSKDLINWEPQRAIPIRDIGEDALACVSPELYYDEFKQHYLLYWSAEMSQLNQSSKSDADEDEFDVPEKSGKPSIQAEKKYLAFKKTTTDFVNFSKSEAFFQPGISIRDLHLVKDSTRYLLLFRDETAKPKNVQRNLKHAISTYIDGPYSEPSPSISGKSVIFSPVVFKIDSLWMVMAERYKEGKIGAYLTRDFVQFEDYSDSIRYSKGIRPASIITITQKMLKKLRELE